MRSEKKIDHLIPQTKHTVKAIVVLSHANANNIYGIGRLTLCPLGP